MSEESPPPVPPPHPSFSFGPRSSDPPWKRWWFWVIAGVVVLGVVFLITRNGNNGQTASLQTPASAASSPLLPTSPIATTTPCIAGSDALPLIRQTQADLKAMSVGHGYGQVADDYNRLADLYADYPSISIPLRKAARDYEAMKKEWSSFKFGDTAADLIEVMRKTTNLQKKAMALVDETTPHLDEVSAC